MADPTEQENIAANHLRSQGYVVHRCVRSSIRLPSGDYVSNGNDLWGCIDIAAKKRGERVRYCQITSMAKLSEKRRDLRSVPWDVELERVEIWKWIPGQPGGRPGPRLGRHFETYCLDDEYRAMTIVGPFPVPKRPTIRQSDPDLGMEPAANPEAGPRKPAE